MSSRFPLRGTGNASEPWATTVLLVCAAVVEAVLLAGLALAISGVGTGSAVVTAFERLHRLLLRPFAILLPGLGGVARQLVALLSYSLLLVLLVGTSSWVERRRAVY